MRNTIVKIILCMFCIMYITGRAQNTVSINPNDTIKTKTVEENQTDMTQNRNVMLNASDDRGPRSLNVGLPASGVGINILLNGLPISYSIYPMIPIKMWRMDTGLLGFKLNNIGTSAVESGDVGYTADVSDNFGIPLHKTAIMLKSNHYGLLNGAATAMGEIGNGGTMFAITLMGNFDPGTFKTGIGKYYADKTTIFRANLSQIYKFNGTIGRLGVGYRYVESGGVLGSNVPYQYNADGSVSQFKDIKIGRSSFFEKSGIVHLRNPLKPADAPLEEHHILDGKFKGHNLDVINNIRFPNGLMSNTIVRYLKGWGGGTIPMPISAVKTTPGEFKYKDGRPYTKDHAYLSVTPFLHDVPATYLAVKSDITKKSGNHRWKASLSNQYYKITDFVMTTTTYFQEVADDPEKIINTGGYSSFTDEYGNISLGYNALYEYISGWENKTALVFTDKWKLNNKLSLDLGLRLEYHRENGTYAPEEARADGVLIKEKFKRINRNYFNPAFSASGVWKAFRNFGFIADVSLNQRSPALQDYSNGEDEELKKSNVTNGGVGIYYNNGDVFNLVSKLNYIKRTNYVGNQQYQPPHNTTLTTKIRSTWDIETLGWTTDFMFKPFRGFELHFMATLQNPRYKNYSGEVSFSDGSRYGFDFSNKVPGGVSKYLLEIDPSYKYRHRGKDWFKVWGSARYFSKTYANKPNTLTFAPRWETFIGVNVYPTKNMDLGITIVNPLNQKGATGNIGSTDMFSVYEVSQMIKNNPIIAGGYMRPFTVEFSATYIF